MRTTVPQSLVELGLSEIGLLGTKFEKDYTLTIQMF